VTRELAPRIPEGIVVVSESGMASRGDLLAAAAAGAHAVLVGETLVRAPDPGRRLRELLGDGPRP